MLNRATKPTPSVDAFALTGGCLWAHQPVFVDGRGCTAGCAVCARLGSRDARCCLFRVTAGHQGHSPRAESPRLLPILTQCSFRAERHGWRVMSAPLPPASSPPPPTPAAPADARPPWAGGLGLPRVGAEELTLSPASLHLLDLVRPGSRSPIQLRRGHLISEKCSSSGFAPLLTLTPAPRLLSF